MLLLLPVLALLMRFRMLLGLAQFHVLLGWQVRCMPWLLLMDSMTQPHGLHSHAPHIGMIAQGGRHHVSQYGIITV